MTDHTHGMKKSVFEANRNMPNDKTKHHDLNLVQVANFRCENTNMQTKPLTTAHHITQHIF